MTHEELVREALARAPRWHVVHWRTPGTSTLLCLWVGGQETLVAIDGTHMSYHGDRLPVGDGQLANVLRAIQQEKDAAVLAGPEGKRAQQWLIEQWQAPARDGAIGSWTFPRGGYVQWLFNDGLHVEASEGGTYHRPMPEPLCKVLVDLGWNPPDHQFRNCWLQPEPGDFEHAAATCVLTPMAAFGCASLPDVEQQ